MEKNLNVILLYDSWNGVLNNVNMARISNQKKNSFLHMAKSKFDCNTLE
jgi:hypothetical protein